MKRRVAVVTDSTAYLPDSLVEERGITVVPLQVSMGGTAGTEGSSVTPDDVARALVDRRTAVTTSRPAPADFASAYQAAFDAGAESVVSLHLSGKLSGTCAAAQLAAEDAAGPVEVLDSGAVAMGLGFAVLAAVDAADAGQDLDEVTAAARSVIERTTILFYVDTLEFLRRGGRLGAAAALLGTALAVKPILHVVDGAVVLKEKVRTSARALARLEDLAAEAAGEHACDLAVHHLAAGERASALRDRLVQRIPGIENVVFSEVGAVVGAHTGPGVLGVVIVRR